MAYSKRYVGGFVDLPSQTTAIDSTFLNAVEAALLKLFDTDPTVDGQVAQWISASSKYGPALILNKNVDAAAGIVKSKLNLSGANGIVNADVAGAAAIARSKLDFGTGLLQADMAPGNKITASTMAGGPPGTPSDGDIWIALAVDANGTVWQFRYNAGSASAYKWEFIGGPPAVSEVYATSTTASTAVIDPGGGVSSVTVARAGDYEVSFGCTSEVSTAGANTGVGVFLNVAGALIGGDDAHAVMLFSPSGGETLEMTGYRTIRVAAVAATSVMKVQWRVFGASVQTLLGTQIRVTPVRIA